MIGSNGRKFATTEHKKFGHVLEGAKMTNGYTLGSNEGEQLVLRGGNIFIKTDPSRGSKGVTTVTQQVLAGVGVPIHRHLQTDETFYVLEGSGTVILDD